MYDYPIKFIKELESTNIPGQGRKKNKAEREVNAKLLNVGMKEFYQAQATGLQPELKFEIADYLDYQNEKEVVYEGRTYKIMRTYRKGRRLEITVYGGVNNANA